MIEPVYVCFVPESSLSLLPFLAVLLAVLAVLGVPLAFIDFVVDRRGSTKIE